MWGREGYFYEYGYFVVRYRVGWFVFGGGGGNDVVGEVLRVGFGREKFDRDRYGYDYGREVFCFGRELRWRRRRRR